jgi:hypothetical protein
LLVQSRVNAITRSLHRVAAPLLQIVPRRIKVAPIPTWVAINVDRLRHATVVYHFKKLGAAKSDVSSRALSIHAARRICEMVLQLIAGHLLTPVTNRADPAGIKNSFWKSDVLEIFKLRGSEVDQHMAPPVRQLLRRRLQRR